MKTVRAASSSCFAAFGILLLGLVAASTAWAAQKDGAPKIQEAVAVLHPTEGNQVSGVVHFQAVKEGVKVTADISGLTPGKHGFHIHEYGDCSDPEAKSAGGHYNPFSKPHGGPEAKERHVGDLGNVVANQEGKATYSRVDPLLKLNGPHAIVGRAVVVHAEPDDLKTQPTGGAGARVACGVIGIGKK